MSIMMISEMRLFSGAGVPNALYPYVICPKCNKEIKVVLKRTSDDDIRIIKCVCGLRCYVKREQWEKLREVGRREVELVDSFTEGEEDE